MQEMNELKKIRATKYKNKQRYKDKSKIVLKPESEEHTETAKQEDKIIVDVDSKVFQKRELESNWYRYDPKEEESVIHAKDFSLIASAPISQGGYFQFKSDKTISDEVENEQVVNKLFHLDLEMLNKSLGTIPFYERCDIEEKYLTELQLDEMKQKAESNGRAYEKYMEKIKKELQKENDVKSESEQCDERSIEVLESDLEGDKSQKRTEVNLKEGRENENLEQWLDDILDD